MSRTVIRVEGLGKRYRLGLTHAGSVRELVNRSVAMLRSRLRKSRAHGATESRLQASDHVWALRNVSFEVSAGEVLGIIGRNGAGKSTLLKILSRITRPTEGRAELRGRVASLLEVGTGFHPELTGRENVYMNGTVLGMTRSEIDRAFDSIIDFSGVEAFIDTPVKRYSSGMTVRLGFAVAAHMSPEILIIDEVLAVGDAAFQKKCLGAMKSISEEGRTVIFVSHNMATVSKLCDSCICISDGKVSNAGNTADVVSAYLSDSVSEALNQSARVNNILLHHQSQASLAVVLKSFQILNHEGRSTSIFRTGEYLKLRIGYRAKQRVTRPAFGISITDQYGIELIRLSTSPISGFEIESIDGEGIIELIIPSIGLTGGEYCLSVYASRPKVELIWKLENLARITVMPTDYYKSGFAMENWAGFMVTEHSWQHSPG